jgi:hypothetical protein
VRGISCAVGPDEVQERRCRGERRDDLGDSLQ